MPIESPDRAPSDDLPPAPRRFFFLRAAAVASLFALVALVLASGAVPCLFARVTHVPCPGCGSTRAALALLRLDLEGLARTNPLGPLMALLVAAFGVHVVGVVLRDGSTARVSESWLGRSLVRAVLVVAVLQVVLWGSRFFGAFGGPVAV
jgi:hypothetical protein